MSICLRRREFIATLGGAAVWPLAVSAQQGAVPVVGLVSGLAENGAEGYAAAFRKGLGEAGAVDHQNTTIEYHWLNGQYDGLPALMADLVRRRVAVIATPAATQAALAAKDATATVPIVFAIGFDPVKLGLVTSLARPGGNVTGFNWLTTEVTTKRLALLRELMPKAVRIAVLVNPANPTSAETKVHGVTEAAHALGLQVQLIKATTANEINAAFAALAGERPDAVLVAPDAFFYSRRVQIANLAARDRIPTVCSTREEVLAGGLMSYGTPIAEGFRQVGVYTGSILKGAAPADLPVVQSTKFELIVNVQTARLLSLDIPPTLFALATEVIE